MYIPLLIILAVVFCLVLLTVCYAAVLIVNWCRKSHRNLSHLQTTTLESSGFKSKSSSKRLKSKKKKHRKKRHPKSHTLSIASDQKLFKKPSENKSESTKQCPLKRAQAGMTSFRYKADLEKKIDANHPSFSKKRTQASCQHSSSSPTPHHHQYPPLHNVTKQSRTTSTALSPRASVPSPSQPQAFQQGQVQNTIDTLTVNSTVIPLRVKEFNFVSILYKIPKNKINCRPSPDQLYRPPKPTISNSTNADVSLLSLSSIVDLGMKRKVNKKEKEGSRTAILEGIVLE